MELAGKLLQFTVGCEGASEVRCISPINEDVELIYSNKSFVKANKTIPPRKFGRGEMEREMEMERKRKSWWWIVMVITESRTKKSCDSN